MICNLEKTPAYIENLKINPSTKEVLRDKHYSLAMEILNLSLNGSNIVRTITSKSTGKQFITAGKSMATDKYNELVKEIGKINAREGGPVVQIRNLSIDNSEKYVVGIDLTSLSDVYDFISSEEIEYESFTSDAAKILAKDAYRAGLVTKEQINEVYKNKNNEAYVNYRMNEDLKNKIFSFLNKLNFTVEQTDEIVNKYGANAIANIVKKTVQYAYGNEVLLPEEAAHVYVELLPKGHPLYKEMMDAIESDPIYPLIYEQYKDDDSYQDEDGNPNIEKIKKEAIGQRIAKEIYAINNNQQENPKILQWLNRLLDYIKSLINSVSNQDPAFTKVANNILQGNITFLTRNDFELEEEADLLYKNRQSDYDAVREDIENSNKKEDVINSLKNTINQVKAFKKKLNKEEDIEANRIFSDIQKRLEALKITDDNDQTDYMVEAIKTYTDFMKETDVLYKLYLKRIRNVLLMENGDPKILELNHLLNSTLLLNRFLQDLQDVTMLLEDNNPVSKFMDNILGTKSKFENTFRQVSMDILQNVFSKEIFGQDYLNLKAKVEARVAELEKQKTIPGAPIEQIDKSIEMEWKELELGPSDEKIKSLLNGTAGDMSFFSANLQRAIASNDFLVAGLQKKFEESIFDNVKELINTANKTDTAHKEFIKDSKSNVNNDEATYDPLTEVVTVTIGFDKDGKPITNEKLFLLREYDPTYKVELDTLRLKKSRVRQKKSQTTDAKEHAKLEDEYRDLLNQEAALYKKLERKYTDKYYEMTEQIMDEVLTTSTGEKFTVREATKNIYTERSNAYRDIEIGESLTKMKGAMDIIEDCDAQLKELETLYNKVPGTKEYLIALQLKKYKKNMREISVSKRTKKTDDLFNANLGMMEKMLKRGSINQEQFDIWKKVNTRRTFTEAYKATRNSIIQEMNDITDLYIKKDGTQSLLTKEIFEQLEDISKIYRDGDGYINGNEMEEDSPEKVIKIKELEERNAELRNAMQSLSGLSKDEKKELAQLEKDIANPTTDIDIDIAQQRIDELKEKQENMSDLIDPDHIDQYYALLQRLSELSVTKNTTYYEERFKEELDKHAASIVIDIDKRKSIFIDKTLYKKTENGWESRNGDVLTSIEAEMKYRQSTAMKTIYATEWGLQNHILTNKWVANPNYNASEETSAENYKGSYVKTYTPLYIWRYTEPSDPVYIEEEAPAFKYYERKVNEEYENKNWKDDGGYPIPKKGFYVNKKYEALKNSTDSRDVARFKYLKFLNDLLDEADKLIENVSERAAGKLPTFEKGFFESITNPFSKEGIVKMGNYVGKEFARNFKITEQDKESSYGETLSSEDVILKGMPVFHSSNIELNLQLRDATKAVMAYYAMAVKRHGVNKTKPVANILLKLVSDMDVKDPNIKNFVGKINKVLKRGSQSNRAERIKEMMESIFLGKNRKASKVSTPWGEFDLAKVVDMLLTGSSISVLGFKPIANIKNNISGKFQIGLSSMTNPDVISPINIPKAQAHVSYHMKDMIVDMTKSGNRSLIGQIADYFDFMQGEFMNDFGEKIDWSMIRTVTDLKGFAMSIKGFAEMEQQYVLGVGILMTQMVKRNGKLIRMIDAYELKDGLIQPKDGVEVDKKQEMKVRSFIKEINSRANGNINKVDAAVFEKYALGRMAFHMNKWLIPSALYRVGYINYNVQLNDIEAPIYVDALKSMYFLLKENNWNIARSVKNRKYLRPREKNSQNAMMAETASVIALFALIALAGGYDDDRHKQLKDDTAYNYFRAQYLALLLSTKTEIETLTPIFGIDNLLQKFGSPFVAISTLKLLRRTLIDGFTMSTYKKDAGFWNKGDSKFVADLCKLFAVEGMLKDLFKPVASFESIEKGQNFKN